MKLEEANASAFSDFVEPISDEEYAELLKRREKLGYKNDAELDANGNRVSVHSQIMKGFELLKKLGIKG